MNRKLCLFIAAGLIVGISLVVIGCDMCCNSSKGSGSIVFTDPVTSQTHKATFNYRMECVGSYSDAPDAVRKVSGRLEYQDHGQWKNAQGKTMRVAIHASIDNVVDTQELFEEVYTAIRAGDNYYTEFLPIPARTDPNAKLYCSKIAPKLAFFRGHYRPQHGSHGEGENEDEHHESVGGKDRHQPRSPGEDENEDEHRESGGGKDHHQSGPHGEEGIVTVMVMDLGDRGHSSEDRFEISLKGGLYDGYKQRGTLAHGNIKTF